VEGAVAIAGLGGSITGTNIQGATTGATDSSYRLAMLLEGGPALTLAQFDTYEPTTTVGVSVTITAPTGLYQSNKLLNGADRWAFKPELALTHSFGSEPKWEFDAYANANANAFLYTDNTF